MNKMRLLIACGFAFFCLCAGMRADMTVDAEGGFSAAFPGPVTRSSQPTGATTLHIVNFDKDDMTSFFVMYADQPEGTWARIGGVDKAYGLAANGAMKAQNATLLASGSCKNGDLVGMEYLLNLADKKLICRVRYYIVGNRLYQVMYVGSPGTDGSSVVTAFLDSFRLLPPASR